MDTTPRDAERAGSGSSDSPYVGLKPYEEEDSDRFFGRDADSAVIIGNLRATRLTVLYAGSGVGKSSLLRAGVAALARARARDEAAQRGSPRWLPVVFSDWTEDPVAGLVDAIAEAARQFTSDGAKLDLPRDRIGAAIDEVARSLDTRLLIILDQFEEYLLYRTEHELDDAFADQLAQYVNDSEAHANVLIAVRDDFYSGVGDLFRGRIADVFANSLHIEFLDRDGGRDAIVRPVYDLYNPSRPSDERMKVEEDLVEAVLEQVQPDEIGQDVDRRGDGRPSGNGNGKLIQTTALQIVMSRLWQVERQRDSHVLRRATLDELGGARKITEEYFDETMQRFGPRDRDAAAAMFSLLVTSGGTKIARTAEELADSTHLTTDEARDLLRRLREVDILRRVAIRDTASYEIRHDALARPIGLWRRRRAEQVREEERTRERKKLVGAVGVAVLFLFVAVFAVIQYFEVRQQRIESQSKRLAANALELPILDLASLYALEAYRKKPTDEARRSLLSIAANQQLGTQLAAMDRVNAVAISPDGKLVAAGGFDGDVRTWNLATHRLVGPRGGRFGDRHGAVADVAFGPRGRTLASAGADGAVRLWRVADHSLIAKLPGKAPSKDRPTPGIQGVAFSPHGGKLVAGLNDNTIQLWDLKRRQRIGRPLRGHTGPVSAVSFNRRGTKLASVSCIESHLVMATDNSVRLWDVASGRGRKLTGSHGPNCDVAFSPNGKRLATGSDDDMVRLWDVAHRKPVGKAMRHDGDVTAVAFSSDGKLLASGGRDRTVRLWNVADQTAHTAPMENHTGPVTDVAFRSNGRELASAGLDGLRHWSVASPRERGTPVTGGGLILNVVYSPDGSRIAWQGGADIRIRDVVRSAQPTPRVRPHPITAAAYDTRGRPTKWRGKPGKIDQRGVDGRREIHVKAATGNINNLALARGGRIVAWAATADHTVRLLDVVTQREVVIVDPAHTIKGVALSRDGKTLAYNKSTVVKQVPLTVRGGVALWDVEHHRPLPQQPPPHKDEDHAIAFSHDGKLLAYGGDDRRVRLWDIPNRRLVASMKGHTDQIYGMAFSPDGKTLASSGRDARVVLHDVAARRQIGVPLLRKSSIYSVSFSPDGRTLATGAGGGDLQLFDVETRRALGDPLAGHTDVVFGVAFSPRGRTLASAGADGTVRLWNNYTPDFALRRLCSYIDEGGAEQLWKQVEPAVDFEKPC